MKLLSKIKGFIFKDNDWVEYIETDQPFKIMGADFYEFTWGRISKPSKIPNNYYYSNRPYIFTSIYAEKITGQRDWGHDFTQGIEKEEYKRIKKLALKFSRAMPD